MGSLKPHQIKGLLLYNDMTILELANHLGVSTQAIYKVIRGQSASRRIRAAISHIIGRPIHKIWPDKADKPSLPPAILAKGRKLGKGK